MSLPTEQEFLEVVLETLNLDNPEDITPETPLFGTDLGLDSIDALEIGAAIKQKYDVELKAKDEETRQAFACIRTLHAHVIKMMTTAKETSEENVEEFA